MSSPEPKAALTVQRRAVGTIQMIDGSFRRRGQLTVSGLDMVDANSIPHGLGFKPTVVNFRPRGAVDWYEAAEPDATYIYLAVSADVPFVIDYSE